MPERPQFGKIKYVDLKEDRQHDASKLAIGEQTPEYDPLKYVGVVVEGGQPEEVLHEDPKPIEIARSVEHPIGGHETAGRSISKEYPIGGYDMAHKPRK